MPIITARQIKAARSMLDWTQDDLADNCAISISTIRTIELGKIPRESTIEEIRQTFENKGIEFTDGDGVRYCINDIRSFKGPHACDRFFAEVTNVVRADTHTILLAVKAEEILSRKCGKDHTDNLSRLASLQKLADIKCLLIDMPKPTFTMPGFACRSTHIPLFSSDSLIIYGDKYAHIMSDGYYNFRVAVFDVPQSAKNNRKAFMELWANCPAIYF